MPLSSLTPGNSASRDAAFISACGYRNSGIAVAGLCRTIEEGKKSVAVCGMFRQKDSFGSAGVSAVSTSTFSI